MMFIIGDLIACCLVDRADGGDDRGCGFCLCPDRLANGGECVVDGCTFIRF